jgi:hypothetical protein
MNERARNNASNKYQLVILSTLILETIHSSETSVLTRTTRRHISQDGILHSHRRENLEPYK